jgi:deoxyribose-phosphate aldolase
MDHLEKYIDHTNLLANATIKDIEKIIIQAKEFNFFGICINPNFVEFAKSKLLNSPIKVITTIGFPLGANTTKTKAFETAKAIDDGADEIDMVINISDLLDKRYENVYEDIFQVVNNANKKCVKVIIETCYLSNADKIKACDLIIAAGANFVKTSTGFGNGGATIDDIILLKKASKNLIKIKASGGIKTKDFAIKLINAGANRLGCSSSVEIVG